MRVKVTQEHIDRGEPLSVRKCPIVLAIQDKDDIEGALVSNSFARLVYKDGSPTRRFKLPPWAIIFIDDFDDGRTVKPFEFDMMEEMYENKS